MEAGAFEIACDGNTHAVGLARLRLDPIDHDVESEQIVAALGGPLPPCLALARAVQVATSWDLWAVLADLPLPGGSDSLDRQLLGLMPRGHLQVFLAGSIQVEFAQASATVRDAVAQLGLALLGDRFSVTPPIVTKFRMTREFPHWDTGPRRWSDKELVLLHRMMRVSKGEARPHVDIIPADPLARATLARFIADGLQGHRVLSRADLNAALRPTVRNVPQMVGLLLSTGFLVSTLDGYRTAG